MFKILDFLLQILLLFRFLAFLALASRNFFYSFKSLKNKMPRKFFAKMQFATVFLILFFSYGAKAGEVITKTKIISPSVATILVKWNSEQGLERFERSKYKNDFYQLVNFYQPQINPFYCSIASSVMVLNALHSDENDFHPYSQLTFLNAKTDKIKKREIIEFKQAKKVKNGKSFFDAGLSIKDLSDILSKVYNAKVSLIYASKDSAKSINDFRLDLKKYLNDDKNFVIANFDGAKLGAKVGGHISPLAAYDEASDSVLVLDVALHKETWYFVPLAKLYEAMNSKDGEQYRGYLVVALQN